MHQGLEQWQGYLSEKKLPIFMRTQKDVQALTEQTQLSITQYIGPILFDPGLSAYLFQNLNTLRVSTGKHPLTSLDNAISQLGREAFLSIFEQVSVFEDMVMPEINKQGYKRVTGQACYSALLMKSWALQRNILQPQEAQIAGLLQMNVELLLWCFGDNAMLKIEHLCYVEKQDYQQASENVLGCGIKELSIALAEQWNLPEMVIDGLMSRQDNFTLATGVSYAAELSRVVTHNWYGEAAINLMQKIAKYHGKAEGELEKQLHLNAVEISDILIDKGFKTPAKLLPMLADDKYIDLQYEYLDSKNTQESAALKIKEKILKKRQQEKIVKTNVSDAQIKDSQLIKNRAEKIKKNIEDKQKRLSGDGKDNGNKLNPKLSILIKEFKLMVSKGEAANVLIKHATYMVAECGVQRGIFMVKVPNKKILELKYSVFMSSDIEIKRLQIPINNPHVFTLLMEKTRNVFINKGNMQKYLPAIPDKVKLVLGVKSFFSMSVFVGDHAMGLMYADKKTGELTNEEFLRFQNICKLLCNGIKQSIKNSKN